MTFSQGTHMGLGGLGGLVGCTYARSYNVPQWRRSEGIGIGRIGSFDLRRGKLNRKLSHYAVVDYLCIHLSLS